MACWTGDLEMVKLVVRRRARVSVSALLTASSQNHPDIVEYLVEVAGVDIDAADADGMTALLSACAGGNEEVVKMLVRLKADVLARDLVRARSSNSKEEVKELMSLTCDMTRNELYVSLSP